MKILSLFDGMACGMLAMMDAGVNVDRYVAFEIDKYAVQTSSHNFPTIEHRGDVFEADFTEFRGFDFLIGGSPCTYWSIAQKNNRETEASGMGWELFSQYVRALHEAQPMCFIYENNKSMSKAIRASIDEAFGFEAVCINSSLVSAQNRQRLYWVGKRNEDGTYSKVDINWPEDRGIVLKDILDGAGYRIPSYGEEGKSRPVTYSYAQQGPGQVDKNCFPKNPNKQKYDYVAEPVRIPEYGYGTKSRPLSASYSHKGCGEGSLAFDCFHENPNKQVFDYVAEPVAIAVEFDGNVPTMAISIVTGKTYSVFEIRNGHITIKGNLYSVNLADGYYIIRKLTINECKRLQTVPEWYEFIVSDTQAYKMLGNGWTVLVISHLIKSSLV